MKAGIIAFYLLASIIKWGTFDNTRCMLTYVVLFHPFYELCYFCLLKLSD